MRPEVGYLAPGGRSAVALVATLSYLLAACASVPPGEPQVPSGAPESTAPSLSQPVPAQGPQPTAVVPHGNGRLPLTSTGTAIATLWLASWRSLRARTMGIRKAWSRSCTARRPGSLPRRVSSGHPPTSGQSPPKASTSVWRWSAANSSDGFSDLAVGNTVWEGKRGQGGDVLVLYGSADGLSPVGSRCGARQVRQFGGGPRRRTSSGRPCQPATSASGPRTISPSAYPARIESEGSTSSTAALAV